MDERSLDSEFDGPVFRVFLFDRRGSTLDCGVHEITDADVSEVIAWADDQGADLYAIALVIRCGDQVQAHWIEGTDANNRPWDSVERATRERMFRRFGIPLPEE